MKIDLRTSNLKDITALSRAQKGLYLVRLTRGNEMDRLVVVDSNRGLILY